MSATSRQTRSDKKGCVLFLLDQSRAMDAPRAQTGRRKCEDAAALISGWLNRLAAPWQSGGPVGGGLDVGVLGYRTDQTGRPVVRSLLNGPRGATLVPILDVVQGLADEEAAGEPTLPPVDRAPGQARCETPAWIEPVADGTSPQCEVLYAAYAALEEWIGAHPTGFPPIVVHVTGGPSDDGNPIPYAKSLRKLATDDGPLLLLNVYLREKAGAALVCPNREIALPDQTARTLFRMSSQLPQPLLKQLQAAGHHVGPGARGLAIDSDLFTVLLPHVPIGQPSSPLAPERPEAVEQRSLPKLRVRSAPGPRLVEGAKTAEAPETEPAGQQPPPYADENVQFTVYRPKAVRPECWYPLLAFAHLDELPADAGDEEPDPIEAVRREAEKILGPQIDDYQPRTRDSSRAVPREGEITFVPEMEGIEFEPARQTLQWKRRVHKAQFYLRAPAALDGQTIRGRMSVFLGAILLADIPLRVKVDSRREAVPDEPNVVAAAARPYRKIFASYSHKDEAIVREVEHYVETLGDRYLRDCKDLRSGEQWDERLLEMIDQADVFQLFWSTNSMRSPFVRREWEYALALDQRGSNFVRPTYWEDPFPESPQEDLPPPSLRRIHFTRLAIADRQRWFAPDRVDAADHQRIGAWLSDAGGQVSPAHLDNGGTYERGPETHLDNGGAYKPSPEGSRQPLLGPPDYRDNGGAYEWEEAGGSPVGPLEPSEDDELAQQLEESLQADAPTQLEDAGPVSDSHLDNGGAEEPSKPAGSPVAPPGPPEDSATGAFDAAPAAASDEPSKPSEDEEMEEQLDALLEELSESESDAEVELASDAEPVVPIIETAPIVEDGEDASSAVQPAASEPLAAAPADRASQKGRASPSGVPAAPAPAAAAPAVARRGRRPIVRAVGLLVALAALFLLALGIGAVATYSWLDSRAPKEPPQVRPKAAAHVQENSDATKAQPIGLAAEPDNGAGRQKTETFRALADAIGDLPSFRDRLDRFAAQYPNSPLGADFRRVLDEDLPLVERLSQWHKMLETWSATDMRRVTARQAKSMLADAESLLRDFTKFPPADAVRQRLEVLAAIANRIDDEGTPIKASLVQLFQHPAASIPFVLQTQSGTRYYLPAAPTQEDEQLAFQYAADLHLERKTMRLARDQMDAAGSGRISHRRVADDALAALAQMDDEHWESVLFRILRDLHAEPRMDPVVKVHWMTQVLAVACRGSQPLRGAFAPHLQRLQTAGIGPQTNWLDPDDPEVQAARARCKKTLEQLPDLNQAGAAAAARYKALRSFSVPSRYRWIGLLYRNEQGEWGCAWRSPPAADSAALLVLGRDNSDGPIRVHRIGQVVGGAAAVEMSQSGQFREGRPVLTEIRSGPDRALDENPKPAEP